MVIIIIIITIIIIIIIKSCIYNAPNDAVSGNRIHIPYKDDNTIHIQDTKA